MEVWLSGLRRHPAKMLLGFIAWAEGSNPSTSSKIKSFCNRVFYFGSMAEWFKAASC